MRSNLGIQRIITDLNQADGALITLKVMFNEQAKWEHLVYQSLSLYGFVNKFHSTTFPYFIKNNFDEKLKWILQCQHLQAQHRQFLINVSNNCNGYTLYKQAKMLEYLDKTFPLIDPFYRDEMKKSFQQNNISLLLRP